MGMDYPICDWKCSPKAINKVKIFRLPTKGFGMFRNRVRSVVWRTEWNHTMFICWIVNKKVNNFLKTNWCGALEKVYRLVHVLCMLCIYTTWLNATHKNSRCTLINSVISLEAMIRHCANPDSRWSHMRGVETKVHRDRGFRSTYNYVLLFCQLDPIVPDW